MSGCLFCLVRATAQASQGRQIILHISNMIVSTRLLVWVRLGGMVTWLSHRENSRISSMLALVGNNSSLASLYFPCTGLCLDCASFHSMKSHWNLVRSAANGAKGSQFIQNMYLFPWLWSGNHSLFLNEFIFFQGSVKNKTGVPHLGLSVLSTVSPLKTACYWSPVWICLSEWAKVELPWSLLPNPLIMDFTAVLNNSPESK